MVVDDFDSIRAGSSPDEAAPELVVAADAVLAWGNAQVVQTACDLQLPELAAGHSFGVGTSERTVHAAILIPRSRTFVCCGAWGTTSPSSATWQQILLSLGQGPGRVPLGLTLIEAQKYARRAEQLAVLKTFAEGELLRRLPFRNLVGGSY